MFILIKVTSYKKSRRFNTRLNEYLTTIKKGEPRAIEAWINYHLKPQYSYFTACPFTRTQLPTTTCSNLCKMKSAISSGFVSLSHSRLYFHSSHIVIRRINFKCLKLFGD